MVLLATDDECVSGAVQGRERLGRRRRSATWAFLVHPVEDWKVEHGGVDQMHLMSAAGQRPFETSRGFNALSIGPN